MTQKIENDILRNFCFVHIFCISVSKSKTGSKLKKNEIPEFFYHSGRTVALKLISHLEFLEVYTCSNY